MLSKESAPAEVAGVSPRLVKGVMWVVFGLLVAGLSLRLSQTVAAKRTPVASPEIPSVSVTQVGMTSVPRTVDPDRHVIAGDHVKKGQLLARLNTSVLAPQVTNLEAALEQSRAEAQLATAEYHRAVTVGAAGALSAEETERRKSAVVTAAAKVKFAAAQLAEAEARLARAEIRAPADGIILTRTIEIGQTATPGGEPLFRLSEGGEVELRGQVAEQDLPLLKVSQPVTVHLTGSAMTYAGTVRLLGAVVDPQTRLGTVRVALAPDVNLRPGAFATAAVTISDAQREVLPQTAVLTDERGSYVLIVDAEHKVQRRSVRVGSVVGSGVVIADGVKRDERVVATAGAFLQEGELVRPVAPPPESGTS